VNPIAGRSPGSIKKPNATPSTRIDGVSAAIVGNGSSGTGRISRVRISTRRWSATGHVRGHEHVLKRLLVHAGAFNLGSWYEPARKKLNPVLVLC
jgi:hypothetical protein